ncbi:MAG: hypothetical protein ACLVDI_17745 [Thomasclavelia ramosa]
MEFARRMRWLPCFYYHPRDDEGVYGRLKIPYNYSAVTAACLAVERKKYIQVGD